MTGTSAEAGDDGQAQIADVRLVCDEAPGVTRRGRRRRTSREHVRELPGLWRELVEGRVAIDRWPLRV
jgi:hypothetical protein